MSRIILIGCGRSKAAEASEARDLYTGSLFRDRLAYVERVGDPAWIVSARHGLVALDQWLTPYDFTIDQLSEVDRAAWAVGTVGQLLDELPDNARLRDVNVEIHAGAPYAEPLESVLVGAGLSTSRPVRGLGIGEQRAWYAQRRRWRGA